MSKVTASTDLDKVKPEDFPRYSAIFADNVQSVLNNGLDFGSNFNSQIISVNFSNANVDTLVAHGLSRVVSGYLVLSANAALIVYDGTQGSTQSVVYLRSSAVGTAQVMIF